MATWTPERKRAEWSRRGREQSHAQQRQERLERPAKMGFTEEMIAEAAAAIRLLGTTPKALEFLKDFWEEGYEEPSPQQLNVWARKVPDEEWQPHYQFFEQLHKARQRVEDEEIKEAARQRLLRRVNDPESQSSLRTDAIVFGITADKAFRHLPQQQAVIQAGSVTFKVSSGFAERRGIETSYRELGPGRPGDPPSASDGNADDSPNT